MPEFGAPLSEPIGPHQSSDGRDRKERRIRSQALLQHLEYLGRTENDDVAALHGVLDLDEEQKDL